MDDLRMAETRDHLYRCPGESYTIDRSVHLGRLAAFYPGCRDCVHRDDMQTLSTLQVEQWNEVARRDHQAPRFTVETFSANSLNAMSTTVVRRLATALGVVLWRDDEMSRRPRNVLVGADGHWGTSEFLAAACEALQWAGCRTTEIGAVTSPALAAAVHHLQADAALWLGNSGGEPHAIDLKVWGRGGRPWSSPGELDTLADAFAAQSARPKRRGGGLDRADADAPYLAALKPMYHALRPLRLVVSTTCEPLLRYLSQLTSGAACEILQPVHSAARHAATDSPHSLSAHRMPRVARRVIDERAHFGLWISGDGEACQFVDECGAVVDSSRVLLLLAGTICREQPAASLVLEREATAELVAALGDLGAQTTYCDRTRQVMSDTIRTQRAVFGGGPSGRFWFSGEPAAPDALLTLSLLLTVLSESDRPLSEVLDAT